VAVMRGHGLKPSTRGKIAHRLGASQHPLIAASLAAGPVGSQDFSQFIHIFDQGRTSGCWMHSRATLRFAAAQMAGKPIPLPSPLYGMQCLYAHDRGLDTAPGAPLPPLYDVGAELQDAANVGAEWGDVPYQTPQQGGGTDCPATIDDLGQPIPLPELMAGELELGAKHAFDGEYSIPVDSDAPRLLMATLDAGILVWDGFFASSQVENLGPNDILGETSRLLPGGGHSNFYTGYDINSQRKYPIDGPVFFKGNTWGPGWCRDGFYTVNVAHVMSAWDLFVFAVKV
jgi:hypothetical protein